MAKTPLAPANMSFLFTGRKFFEATRSPAAAAVRMPALFPALVITDSTPPSQPGTPVGTAVSTSQINWTWTASTDTGGSGFAGYRVYLDGASTPTTTVTTNAYSSTGHSANSVHTLRVEAFDNAGNSISSGTGSQTTQQESSGTGQQVSNLVVLERFDDWRLANNNFDKYFDVYNGATGDAGPSQVCQGVSGNALRVSCPASNVMYVDAACAPANIFPSYWMQGHIQSGTWNQNINRMQVMLKAPFNYTRRADGGGSTNVGTYIKPTDNTSPGDEGTDPQNGHHYYHSFNCSYYTGRWVKLIATHCPDHERGPAGIDQNVIPQYFHQMTRFYVTPFGYYPGNPAGVWELGPIYLFEADDEPDNDIRNITICYTGQRYEVTWASRINQTVNFDISWLAGTTLPTFNSGTVTLNAAQSPGDTYIGCAWQSPLMAESATGMTVGIRKSGATQYHKIFLPLNFGPNNPGLVGV